MPALRAPLALRSGSSVKLGRSRRLRQRATPSNTRLGTPAAATHRCGVIEGEASQKLRAPRIRLSERQHCE